MIGRVWPHIGSKCPNCPMSQHDGRIFRPSVCMFSRGERVRGVGSTPILKELGLVVDACCGIFLSRHPSEPSMPGWVWPAGNETAVPEPNGRSLLVRESLVGSSTGSSTTLLLLCGRYDSGIPTLCQACQETRLGFVMIRYRPMAATVRGCSGIHLAILQ